jgi:glycerophosphoryl diester phosphodiesterase
MPMRQRRGAVPIVIAHRGASGYLPEHTLAAYAVAILQGADFIEPDLVMTRDGALIARHDNELSLTTDIARHPDLADRHKVKTVDGVTAEGWFSEDCTLAEIGRLRAIERIPELRPGNARFDGQFGVPTLQEIIDLVRGMERLTSRSIGIYPEIKHPTHFAGLGLAMEEPLVQVLHRNGYRGVDAGVLIQCFEIASLQALHRMTDLPLVQLLGTAGRPYDVEAAGGQLTYEQMATPAGLAEIATYAAGVGPEKYRFVIPQVDGAVRAENVTPFVARAHAAGLVVHAYTFRAENAFLPANFRSGTGAPGERGRAASEVLEFLRAGIDGFFIDQPDVGVLARERFLPPTLIHNAPRATTL